MTNLDSILKSRDITLSTKVHLVQAMVFPVVMYVCKRWTIKKAVTNLNSILKSRDITLPTRVPIVKAMVFPVDMYGCESWTIKKLNSKELMLLNCDVGEDSWESLGLQGDQTSQS